MPTDYDIAFEHYKAGRTVDAQRACRQILQRDANHARALHLTALISADEGNIDGAVQLLRRAIAAKPKLWDIQLDLARILLRNGHATEACAQLRALDDKHPVAAADWTLLTTAFLQEEKFVAAQAELKHALSRHPNESLLRFNLAVAFHKQLKIPEAIDAYRAVLAVRPDLKVAWGNLADLLAREGNFAEAEAVARQAISLDPASAVSWSNLASVLIRADRPDEAVDAARKAAALDPTEDGAHMNLAISLLTLGRLEESWQDYEFRPGRLAHPAVGRKIWDGASLDGERIVLRCEQGFGDVIQFIRYAALIRDERGGRVEVECPPELADLLTTHEAVESVHVWGQPQGPTELEISMMSLPHRFQTSAQTIPARVPYLRHDPTRAARLSPLVPTGANITRVGLVWSGNPRHHNDAARSCPLAALKPLFQLPNVQFFNLQSGADSARHRKAAAELNLIDLGGACQNLADLAAAMSLLDLIITVDTAPAHLAGALALPIWLLLPHVADWRWQRDRADSPWYPTMRIFRQPAPGDWPAVVREVVMALQDRVNSAGR